MRTLDSPLPPDARAAATPATGRLFLRLLERMPYGALTLTAPNGETRRFGARTAADSQATEADLTLLDWKVCREVLAGGDIAFAEAYMDGRWHTSDLVRLLTLIAFNQSALEPAFYGSGWRPLLFRLKHLLHSNSRRRARRNIVAHYDLGNEFYRLWLDPTMTYSAALFEGDLERSLGGAQRAKYARILSELRLPPSAHILEIGGGWGGFAETAAAAGHRVTSISLSDAQTAYARERIAQAGLAERVEFRIQDYRDTAGQYDGVASIEMFEAVGERYWPAYFDAVRRLLKRGGRAAIQTITIAEDRFLQYQRTSDFIQQHIFPGGMLASHSRFTGAARAAGLDVAAVRSFGHDYAETLRRWLAAFDGAADAVRALGFSEPFIRCWRFYLAYCAAGFDSETTDVAQYTLVAA